MKFIDHQIGDGLAQRRGPQGLALFDHIIPAQHHRNRGSVGAGSADALFLHGADQGRLGIPGGRLGEVLFGLGFLVFGLVPLFQRRQGGLIAVGGGLVQPLLIQG